MRRFLALLLSTGLLLTSCGAAPEEEPVRTPPDELMALAEGSLVEFMPSLSTEESFTKSYGEFEHITYYSETCERKRGANVLLPAGYDKKKKYPVLYAMHGYWGDEYSLLDQGDSSLKLRQIIGNAIADGDAEEMIVVFPYIFASKDREVLDGMNDESNRAYDNFINDLTNDLMPYIEKHYSVATGRANTAITGFSMGGRESLYIGFSRPDLFGYIGAVCPAPGVTTDCLSEDEMIFDEGEEPYLLMISAGSNDTVVYTTPQGYHDLLDKNGVRHVWNYVNGGDHGGMTIRPHFYNFIRFLFK